MEKYSENKFELREGMASEEIFAVVDTIKDEDEMGQFLDAWSKIFRSYDPSISIEVQSKLAEKEAEFTKETK